MRSRSSSADNITHTLAPPTFCGVGSMPSVVTRTSGSKVQRNRPVRASKPRIAPLIEFSLLNLFDVVVTTTVSRTRPAGESSCVPRTVAAGSIASINGRTSTTPPVPKSGHNCPSRASIASRLMSGSGRNSLVAQRASGPTSGSRHCDKPRHLKRPAYGVLLNFGSKTQRSSPVAGSSAKTFVNGVQTMRWPPASSARRIGVAWKSMNIRSLGFSSTAPVRNVHARSSPSTLSRLMKVSGEKRLPPMSPP